MLAYCYDRGENHMVADGVLQLFITLRPFLTQDTVVFVGGKAGFLPS